MKKLNRFALLALIGGLLSSALVMGCGGSTDTADTEGGAMSNGTSNGAAGNASSSNSAQ